jgi:hypothetical protein
VDVLGEGDEEHAVRATTNNANNPPIKILLHLFNNMKHIVALITRGIRLNDDGNTMTHGNH